MEGGKQAPENGAGDREREAGLSNRGPRALVQAAGENYAPCLLKIPIKQELLLRITFRLQIQHGATSVYTGHVEGITLRPDCARAVAWFSLSLKGPVVHRQERQWPLNLIDDSANDPGNHHQQF